MRQLKQFAPILICALLTLSPGIASAWQTAAGDHQVDGGPGQSAASPMVTVDHVDGLTPGGYIEEGATLTFHIRLYNDAEMQTCISNGYRIYGEGLNWTGVGGEWNPAYNWDPSFGSPCFFDVMGIGTFINIFSTGAGADTIGFAGLVGQDGLGLPSGFDDVAYSITVGPITGSGESLVIDSSFWYPANYWLWCNYSNEGDVGWGGPYEFPMGCCDLVGDLDETGQVDPMDLMYLVEWMWQGGPDIPCLEEADVDGSGRVDPADVIYMVEWLWEGGPDLADCP